MRILFALLGIVTGLLLVFGGYRLARLIIPLEGFLTGLSLNDAVLVGLTAHAYNTTGYEFRSWSYHRPFPSFMQYPPPA
ncbi:MAG TPA: hypothetical protein VFH39_02135 [Candidatus Saccharimonadales bacterium]|nr:hypothetical protein [Candidatus Saccharimonadales bacterium]